MKNRQMSLPVALHFPRRSQFSPRDARTAERGIVAAGCLSVRPSVRL